MAIDPQRRRPAVTALNAAGMEALACFSPPDVLLISGYWPVMGKSSAFLTRENALGVPLPEDEAELAEAASDAHLIPDKNGTRTGLLPLSWVLAASAHEAASCLQIYSSDRLKAIRTSSSSRTKSVTTWASPRPLQTRCRACILSRPTS